MIQLPGGFAITADEHCYMVGSTRQRRNRADTLRNVTYYSTMEQAVRGAVMRVMRKGVEDGEITTLRDFLEELERRRTAIQEMTKCLDT